jgi:hypothetical protein
VSSASTPSSTKYAHRPGALLFGHQEASDEEARDDEEHAHAEMRDVEIPVLHRSGECVRRARRPCQMTEQDGGNGEGAQSVQGRDSGMRSVRHGKAQGTVERETAIPEPARLFTWLFAQISQFDNTIPRAGRASA